MAHNRLNDKHCPIETGVSAAMQIYVTFLPKDICNTSRNHGTENRPSLFTYPGQRPENDVRRTFDERTGRYDAAR